MSGMCYILVGQSAKNGLARIFQATGNVLLQQGQSQHDLAQVTDIKVFAVLLGVMATHSCVLAWRIPGTGEPSGLSSIGSDTTEATLQQQLPKLI